VKNSSHSLTGRVKEKQSQRVRNKHLKAADSAVHIVFWWIVMDLDQTQDTRDSLALPDGQTSAQLRKGKQSEFSSAFRRIISNLEETWEAEKHVEVNVTLWRINPNSSFSAADSLSGLAPSRPGLMTRSYWSTDSDDGSHCRLRAFSVTKWQVSPVSLLFEPSFI